MRGIHIILAACLALVVGGLAQGDEKDAAARRQQTTEQLIENLGDDQYFAREAASQALLELGLAALPTLEDQAKNPNREIRFRCRRIAIVIRQGPLEQRLKVFVNDAESPDSAGLPWWTTFRTVAGDSRETRRMFAAMSRREGQLLRAMERGRQTANPALMTHCQHVLRTVQDSDDADLVLSVSTFLLLAGDPNVVVNEATADIIFGMCLMPVITLAIEMSARKEVVKQLLSRAVVREKGRVKSTSNALSVSMQYDLPAGLTPATRVLDDGLKLVSLRRQAILTVAKLGDASHSKLLESAFGDSTVYKTRRIRQRNVQTQVRDIALAALVLLNNEDHQQYGFQFIERHETYVFEAGSCGFETDGERQKALTKWRMRSSTEPKP